MDSLSVNAIIYTDWLYFSAKTLVLNQTSTWNLINIQK